MTPYHRAGASFEERAAASIATLRVLIVIVAVAVAVALGLGAYGFVQAHEATGRAAATARAESRLAHRLAGEALARANEAKATVKTIKAQRDSFVLSSCRDQNRRHHNTIAYIHAFGVHAAKRKHVPLATEEASLEPFVLLMDAAIPHRNCQQVLAQARGH
ncbi:MAG TPA: hypothetical protein VFH80_24605 [Solirubrobacteraceae bacterium]|nr:hypothetical protein [Solirubrobacteraceae bacterium]